mgnify:FL=1
MGTVRPMEVDCSRFLSAVLSCPNLGLESGIDKMLPYCQMKRNKLRALLLQSPRKRDAVPSLGDREYLHPFA